MSISSHDYTPPSASKKADSIEQLDYYRIQTFGEM